MLVAGEASGDVHGATLCRSLRRLAPDCRLFGMGGARMAAAGMELLADVTSVAAIGTTEAMGRLPLLYRAYRRLRQALTGAVRPGVMVLIDFPEFNLRLARTARRAGVPVVYFIAPQVWAWRPWRVRTIRRRVSLVLAVFPFEPGLYRRAGVAVAFVGHPLLDVLADVPDRSTARRRLGVSEDAILVGLLPGSRGEEIERMLPLMVAAAVKIGSERGDVQFMLGRAPTVDADVVGRHVSIGPPIRVVDGRTHELMRAADLLFVTSGTATLEATLLGTPMIVGYRPAWATELMGRLLVKIPWISLANIMVGRTVVPELIGAEATAERFAAEALKLLADPVALAAQRSAFAEVTGTLGAHGVGERAARCVLATARS
jgi:lipid-A-disaccharide synthase